LTIVTLLTGFFRRLLPVSQFLRGKGRRASQGGHGRTFIEISNAFAAVHMLQESILADYAEARMSRQMLASCRWTRSPDPDRGERARLKSSTGTTSSSGP
jgi:hypothetical protein